MAAEEAEGVGPRRQEAEEEGAHLEEGPVGEVAGIREGQAAEEGSVEEGVAGADAGRLETIHHLAQRLAYPNPTSEEVPMVLDAERAAVADDPSP